MKTIDKVKIYDYATDSPIEEILEEGVDLEIHNFEDNSLILRDPKKTPLPNGEHGVVDGVQRNSNDNAQLIPLETTEIIELSEKPILDNAAKKTEPETHIYNDLPYMLLHRADTITDAIINNKELDVSFFLASDNDFMSEDDILAIVDQAESLEIVECEGLETDIKDCFSQIHAENIVLELRTEEKTALNRNADKTTHTDISVQLDNNQSEHSISKREKNITTPFQNKKKNKAPHLYYSTRFFEKPDLEKLPAPGLSKKERISIEEDIVAENSLVIEENVKDIKNLLLDYWNLQCSNCEDISDNVVILENDTDVERFINGQSNIAHQDKLRVLLEYFEGLFEQLPEDTLNNFAKSKYFDMYIEFMNQLNSGKNGSKK